MVRNILKPDNQSWRPALSAATQTLAYFRLIYLFPTGQLCENTQEEPYFTPTLWELNDSINDEIVSFAVGYQSSYLVLESGSYVQVCTMRFEWCWTELGDDSTSISYGTITTIGDAIEIHDIWSGASAKSAFFFAQDGKLYGTGLNDRGQLGVGDKNNRKDPKEVKFEDDSSTDRSAYVSASKDHTFAWKVTTLWKSLYKYMFC